MSDGEQPVYKNPMVIGGVAAAVVLLVVLIWWMGYLGGASASENYVNRTVNMIGFRHPDPTEYKYTNRLKEPNGMDDNDYYLENDMTHRYGLGPELLNEAAFASRVIAEDTALKEQEATQSAAQANTTLAEGGDTTEHFVGGMSY